ncbi:MAG: ATP-binding cassette domain-containing protein [Planctomycetes bacterium]|nr:ATP-binding cassette domain-containing protein [Planctomycetota bacterium]
MALVELRELTIGFRGPALLDNVTCQIERGERIGLLGRNGSGKTTLMRMLRGNVQPDHGEIRLAAGARVALLPQDVPQLAGSVADVVTAGLKEGTSSDACEIQQQSEAWRSEHQVEQILGRMQLDGDMPFDKLSAGMKRRVLLAQALVAKPDLLLLDEPTNHLDIDAINWLEEFLSRFDATFLFVTHDRVFLRKLARRILEIDRGRLFDWSCDYDTFVARKEAALVAEEKEDALFDKRLAEEERWIRQGIKARRTRNEGRVRALEAMRRVRAERQAAVGTVKMQIQDGQRSGNLVCDVEKISFTYPDRPIVQDFSTTIFRGDKVGIVGANGAGKTTLLRLLLGQLEPQAGRVRLGSNLQIAYFDQLREQLRDDATVQENVADGYTTVQLGDRSRHVIGYLQDFLFTPERSRTQVRYLSGGERNRLLLARLMAKPANVIVLDEPTNDLDTETLEMLEARLVEFEGTVLVVSHDRAFLNNVVASTIVFEEAGAKEYDGNYDDWLRVRTAREEATARPTQFARENTARVPGASGTPPQKKEGDSASTRRRLSFKEQQELSGSPALIEKLESQIRVLHEAMAQPAYYQRPGEELARDRARLDELESQLRVAYRRWEELEARAQSATA